MSKYFCPPGAESPQIIETDDGFYSLPEGCTNNCVGRAPVEETVYVVVSGVRQRRPSSSSFSELMRFHSRRRFPETNTLRPSG